MYHKLVARHPNVVRILVVIGALAAFVLSAGAPHANGG
jgi:hypothetical protein